MASGKAVNQGKWLDISLPLHNSMVNWPDDPPFNIERVQDLDKGDSYNLSKISMSAHSGTHIDAPLHFLKKGISVGEMSLDITNGPVRVLDLLKDTIEVADIESFHIVKDERILFKTKNSSFWTSDRFMEKYAYLSEETAKYLAKIGVKMVGTDYLSIGGYHNDGAETHRILLEAGIWIIEGLDLSGVTPGEYDLICLPLRLVNGEGSPVRAVLKS